MDNVEKMFVFPSFHKSLRTLYAVILQLLRLNATFISACILTFTVSNDVSITSRTTDPRGKYLWYWAGFGLEVFESDSVSCWLYSLIQTRPLPSVKLLILLTIIKYFFYAERITLFKLTFFIEKIVISSWCFKNQNLNIHDNNISAF